MILDRRVAAFLWLLLHVTSCDGKRVLVTSYGGSGSTGVMAALREGGLGTNSLKNADHLKHGSASGTLHLMRARDGEFCMKHSKDKCFQRVLVVERADPARAIQSTVARFGLQHYRLISRGCQACPSTFLGRNKGKGALLESIFSASGQAKQDVYGLASHVSSWFKVAESHQLMSNTTKWPPILFADVALLAADDMQCLLYAFLDIRDPAKQAALTRALQQKHETARRDPPEALMTDAARIVYDKLGRRVAAALDHSKRALRRAFWQSKRCPGRLRSRHASLSYGRPQARRQRASAR